jgi:3-oxoacyl-[acyl-carrier protein] reductase
MPDLSGRVAIVTGGSRGIGRGICLQLARAGADVAVNYAGNEQAASETVEAVRALGRRAAAFQADVADLAQVEAMGKAALDEFGYVDIVVNNAGVGSTAVGRPTVVDTDPADLQRLMGVHVFGSLHMTKVFVPQMRERGRGDVFMISSVAAQSFGARGGTYNAPKAAMEALAFTLAKEERQHGIRVNIVAPGLVETDMGRNLVRFTRGVQELAEVAENQPFGFLCQPEDIANAVAFLVSDEGRYITNQRITVSGGGF